MKHNEKCFKLTGKTYIKNLTIKRISTSKMKIHRKFTIT